MKPRHLTVVKRQRDVTWGLIALVVLSCIAEAIGVWFR